MSLEIEYSNDELKLEERIFLLNTLGGRLLTISSITALSVFYCGIILFSRNEFLLSVEGIFVAVASVVLAMLSILLGYAWMNAGGHVSSYFEMKGSRTYTLVEKSNLLIINDFGSIKEISLQRCRLLRGPGKVLIVNNSKVYFVPVAGHTMEFIRALENSLEDSRRYAKIIEAIVFELKRVFRGRP